MNETTNIFTFSQPSAVDDLLTENLRVPAVSGSPGPSNPTCSRFLAIHGLKGRFEIAESRQRQVAPDVHIAILPVTEFRASLAPPLQRNDLKN